MKARETRRSRRASEALLRQDLPGKVLVRRRDEGYTQISRWVEDLMKDPEIREKIEYHTRRILKAIAAKL